MENTILQSNAGAIYEVQQEPRRLPTTGLRVTTARSILLTTILYVSLWRATGMSYGLPANFAEEGGFSDPTPMRIMLYSLIPLLGLYAAIDQRFVFDQIKRISVPILIVLFCSAVSILVSIDKAASARGFAAAMLLASGPILYRAKYGPVATFNALGRFVVFAAFANLLYTLAFPRFAIMRGSYAGMVKGLFYHKNLLGQYSAVAFIILLEAGRTVHRPVRGVTYRDLRRWAAMLIYLVLLVAARSSTAVVTLGLGIIMYYGLAFMGRLPGGYTTRYFLVRAIWILIGGLAFFAVLGVAALIADAFGKDLTFSGRTDIWEQLIPLIQQKPLFGYGFAVFRQPAVMIEYVRVGWAARSTHNTYLELALNIGLVGTVAWVVFIFRRLMQKMSTRPRERAEQIVRRKEAVVILLIMIGAFTEAGMMLAPSILWPFMVICLCRDDLRPTVPRRVGQPVVHAGFRNG